ncbi:MAG: hypothetical protein IMF19_16920 [Proteobacteria bacterium]|nr:hypothetical protein [Pseudomonadota bacterium]
MKKSEFIERHGEAGYALQLKRNSERKRTFEGRRRRKEWEERNFEKIIENNRAQSRRGGKYYKKKLEYKKNGVPGERVRVRGRDGYKWRPYKRIIAPESQLHHSWLPNSSEHTGLALVEADAHMHGFIDVIEILGGKISLFTEAEVRERTDVRG